MQIDFTRTKESIMSVWGVKVLYYGKINIPKSALTPGFDPDLVIDWPYLGFLLQNGDRNIVVDTGISENFIIDGKAWGGWPAKGGLSYLEKSLTGAGVRPEDVETVIFTHLHNDHAANATIFKNARLVFQKDEWATLVNPIPAYNFRRDYDYDLIDELRTMHCLRIDGDMEWTDGINIYKTPGHTPGSQSIAVRTEKGTQFIVGDHWHVYCMAFGEQDEIIDMEGNRHKITRAPSVYEGIIPSSLIYNYYDYYDSSYKLHSLMEKHSPEFLLPGHEPSLMVTGA